MGSAQPLRDDPIDLAHANWSRRGWDEAADGMAVITSIMRVQQVLLARVETILRPLGLTFARYEVLMLLLFSRSGCLPVGKIGERLQVHPASVTNAATRLEAAGLVVRRPHPEDGRAVLVEITDAGRAVAADATERLNREVFSRPEMTSPNMRALVDILRDVRREAGDFEQ